jgi:hypothetical protein
VTERDILSAGGLLEILIRVTGIRGDFSGRSLPARNASSVLHAEDYSNSAIQTHLTKMVQLANFFRMVTGVDVKGDLDYLAQLMAHVAISVNQNGPTVTDKRQQSDQMDPLTYKIRLEFSIACVVYFTQYRGYSIDINDLPHDQISKALLGNDWEQLVRIFVKCLRETFIAQLERQFTETSLVPEPAGINASRQLSAESYWNLRSVAMQESWSAADILMLIEAYLSPSLEPHLAFRRTAVTGSEWRRLYDWKHRRMGLCYGASSAN